MSTKPKWIITDHVHPMAREGLEAMGMQVDVRPDIGREALLEIIDGYHGMMISSKTAVDRTLLDRAKALRIVARVGSGMEHVDRAYCEQKGVVCLSSPEGNSNAVAEHAFGMLLSLANRINIANNQLKQGVWEREGNRGFELRGRTVGIIGFGHTGSAFARKFSGWECRVLAYDKYLSGFSTEFARESTYEEVIQQADIISFHIPYNAETHHWIDSAFISRCRPGVILVNTSRGAVADTVALLNGLKEGKIGGICLDVFEDEPVTAGNVHDPSIYSELLSSELVVATPHIAGWSRESKVLLVEVLLAKIENEVKKQRVQH